MMAKLVCKSLAIAEIWPNLHGKGKVTGNLNLLGPRMSGIDTVQHATLTEMCLMV